MEEVEKQVVVVDVDQPTTIPLDLPRSVTGEPMDTDSSDPVNTDTLMAPTGAAPANEPKIIKSIWKSSYELLCPQHNPVSSLCIRSLMYVFMSI